MTAADFKKELKKGLTGGYLFCGKEEYLKRYYLGEVRKSVLQDENDVFCRICLNSDSYTPEALHSAVEGLPVFNDKKLIELYDTVQDKMSESSLESLCEVLSELPAYEYNVLIIYTGSEEFDPGTEKLPSKLMKKLSGYVKPVNFERETPVRLNGWVRQHFSAEGIFASPELASALIEQCGCDMFSLSGEISKLCAYVAARGGTHLEQKDIAEAASASKEIAAFDFANAILDGSAEKAFSILTEMKLRRERPELILSGVYRVICDLGIIKSLIENGFTTAEIAAKLKMHSYKAGLYVKNASKCTSASLSEAAAKCYEADLKIKNSSLDSYTVLDRLVAETAVR